MKVVKTDNNTNTMTLAELEALAQFEASDRKGPAVFHPWVGPGSPVPNCVVLPEGLTRIAVTYLDGEYWVEDGQWYRRDDEGGETPSTTYWSAAGRPPRRSVPGSRSSWA